MVTGPSLTEPRRRALEVLLAGVRTGREVQISNKTSAAGAEHLTVYWQTAGWLRDQGYANGSPLGIGPIELTDAGRELAREQAA